MATIKQKLAIAKILENRGSLGSAMKAAGYSPATVKNPKNLTDSKAFREVLAVLDDARYLRELDKLAISDDDKRAKLQAIDMIMKLKNRYPKEAIDLDLGLKRNDISAD